MKETDLAAALAIGRTEIAATAMQGLLSSGVYDPETEEEREEAFLLVSKAAVRYADALVAELRKPSAAVPYAVEVAEAVLECVELLARTPPFHDERSCAKTIDAVTEKLARVADQARIVRGRR